MIRALVFVSPACGAAAFASPAAQQTAVTGLQRSVSSAPLASAAGDSAPQASTPWTSCILAGLGLGYAAAAASRVARAAEQKPQVAAARTPVAYPIFTFRWLAVHMLAVPPL